MELGAAHGFLGECLEAAELLQARLQGYLRCEPGARPASCPTPFCLSCHAISCKSAVRPAEVWGCIRSLRRRVLGRGLGAIQGFSFGDCLA